MKIISVLQRLIDHVIIRKTSFPFNEQVTSFSSLSGLSATKLLNELTFGPDAKGDKGTVYLGEMNGESLLLETGNPIKIFLLAHLPPLRLHVWML